MRPPGARAGYPAMILLACLLAAPAIVRGADAEPPVLLPLPAVSTHGADVESRYTPDAVSADALGRIWALDRTRGRLLLLGTDGSLLGSFSATGQFGMRSEILSDMSGSGTSLYVLAPSSQEIVLVDLNGQPSGRISLAEEIAGAGEEGFVPSRVLVGFTGTIWLMSPREGGILRFDRRGRFEESVLERIPEGRRPRRVIDAAITPDDAVLLLDAAGPVLIAIEPSGAASDPVKLGEPLAEPACLAVTADRTAYVIEADGRVRVLAPGAPPRIIATGESFAGAKALRAAAAADSILVVADPSRERLVRWAIAR